MNERRGADSRGSHVADDVMKPRIFRSLSSSRPFDALADLVLTLADEGLRKDEIVGALQSALRDAQASSAMSMQEAVLGDILDVLLGFFVPGPEATTAARLIERFSRSGRAPSSR